MTTGNPKSIELAVKAKVATGPRSLTRLLGLFDILASEPDGMTLAELSEKLSSPKSSMLNLFRPLVTEGFLTHEHNAYKLGPAIFRLSSKIISVWNFSGLIHQYLEELSRACGESVFVGVLDKELGLITYTDSIDSLKSVRFSISVGTSRPLYCTAAGRILLTYADRDWVKDYLAEVKLEKLTPNTVANRRDLRKKLDEIRDQGFAVCFRELFEESGGAAAPVFGADGKLAAALGVGAPADRLKAKLPEITSALKEIAAKASGMS